MTAPKQAPVSGDRPRHRRQTNISLPVFVHCTCAATRWRSCPYHFPTLYAERYAKHKAVAR
jgi:hypothetical protein